LLNIICFLKEESSILDTVMWCKLIRLSSHFKNKKWKLIYRGTRDGFRGEDFHRHCDRKAGTVAIIKTTDGNVFGGYTEQLWSLDGNIEDRSAFVFSLVNQRDQPFIVNASSIYCDSDHGPSFKSFDGSEILDIGSDSNTDTNSSSDLGGIYYLYPSYPHELNEKARYILDGEESFQTVEIEVYHLT